MGISKLKKESTLEFLPSQSEENSIKVFGVYSLDTDGFSL